MNKFRRWMFVASEAFNMWRVVPRIIILAYSYLVWSMYAWYKSIPTFVQIKCDSALFEILLAKGQKMDTIKELACSIIGTAGGPTAEQTAFVTIIIGLSSAIFALYTGSGKKYDVPESDNSDTDEPPKPEKRGYRNRGGE